LPNLRVIEKKAPDEEEREDSHFSGRTGTPIRNMGYKIQKKVAIPTDDRSYQHNSFTIEKGGSPIETALARTVHSSQDR